MWKFFICSCQHPFSSSVPAPPPHLLPHAGSCLPHLDIPHDMLVFSKGKPFSHFLCPWFLQKASQLSSSVSILPGRGSLKQHKTAFPQVTHTVSNSGTPTRPLQGLHTQHIHCASPNSLRSYLEPQPLRIICPHDALSPGSPHSSHSDCVASSSILPFGSSCPLMEPST